MLRKVHRRIKFEIQKFITFIKLMSDFEFSEAIQLIYYSKSNSSQNYIELNPKKWMGTFIIRNNFRDKRTLKDVFVNKYHLPINKVNDSTNFTIVDLGSNIGATIKDYKNLYPEVSVYGYEMDKDNYELALKNTAGLRNVHINNIAIWTKEGTVEYNKDDSYDGYSLNIVSEKNNVSVKSTTITRLIEIQNIDTIDYLKMDIEGTEKDILNDSDLEWLNQVKEINIELHSLKQNELDKYVGILEKYGFKTWKDGNHSLAIRACRI